MFKMILILIKNKIKYPSLSTWNKILYSSCAENCKAAYGITLAIVAEFPRYKDKNPVCWYVNFTNFNAALNEYLFVLDTRKKVKCMFQWIIKTSKIPWKLIFVLSNGAIVVFAIAPAIAPAASEGKTAVKARFAVVV